MHAERRSRADQQDLAALSSPPAELAIETAAGSLARLGSTAEAETTLTSSSADSAEPAEIPESAEQAKQPLPSTNGDMDQETTDQESSDQETAVLADSAATQGTSMSQQNVDGQLLVSKSREAQAGPSVSNSAEVLTAEEHQTDAQSGSVCRSELHENAPVSAAALPGHYRSTAATAVTLWGRSKQKAGHIAVELAVATMVTPVVVSGLAVLHVPVGMWAGACLGRAACKKVLGF